METLIKFAAGQTDDYTTGYNGWKSWKKLEKEQFSKIRI